MLRRGCACYAAGDSAGALLSKGASTAPPWEPHPLVTFLVELALALFEGLG